VWHPSCHDCEKAGSKLVGRNVFEREFFDLQKCVEPVRPGKHPSEVRIPKLDRVGITGRRHHCGVGHKTLSSVGGEKARRLLGIIPATIIQFRRPWVAVPGSLLYVLELGPVFERRGDEGRAHRVR
jgi:hypothetical protein